MAAKIFINGGCGKMGEPEPVRQVSFAMGTVVSIVGPTGSGKTTLINDIELGADGSTPTKRQIAVEGASLTHNPVALITQHTSFLSDLPVGEFLSVHARIRHTDCVELETVVKRTLDFANELTGEPIEPAVRMTELSGGQTRALLIADAVIIGNAPIVLLDEIENAGIDRMRALELLRGYAKLYVFVTHDPYIALLSDLRIVMRQGMMVKVVSTTLHERVLARRLKEIDEALWRLRDKIRQGENLDAQDLEVD